MEFVLEGEEFVLFDVGENDVLVMVVVYFVEVVVVGEIGDGF